MKILFLRLALTFTSIILAFTCLFTGADRAGSAYRAEDPGHIKMNAVIVSDTHSSDTVLHDNSKTLTRLFSGVGKSQTKLDALVIPGDLTQCALQKEYTILAAVIKRYVKTDTLIPALGNHDVRGDYDAEDYETNLANYYAFCDTMDVPADKPYWSVNVNGYLFVVLGSEAEEKDRAWFSDKQIGWLDGQLAKAEHRGRPAFIVCHQVIDHTNNVDVSWYFDGSIGEQSDAVRDVIRSHTDNGLKVVFISGHLHEDFSEYSFQQPLPNLYCLNLPSAQFTNEGGIGCTLECYADKVLIRPRNFITGEWLQDAYAIPLG
ncbi:MAG: metallophosphoesterase [Clostridia bacterium]|nr:metallophosphoesterase [Clostridia bacterium]